MPTIRKKQLADHYLTLICNILSACMAPVRAANLRSIFLLAREATFEEFTRMGDSDLEKILAAGAASGRIRHNADDNTYTVPEMPWQQMCELFAQKEYASIPMAISSAVPVMDSTGVCSEALMLRDLRNAFFSGNVRLLSSVCSAIRHSEIYSESRHSDLFAFLFELPQEWIIKCSKPFLEVCARRMLHAAVLQMRNVQQLADHIFATVTDSITTCNLLDYYILSGISGWKKLKTLFERLPEGESARSVRLAITKFLTGRDNEAGRIFMDALTLLRRTSQNRMAYFSSVGGVFMVMSFLRNGNAAEALQHAQDGLHEKNAFNAVYEMLATVAKNRLHDDLPQEKCTMKQTNPLADFFCCEAQYWLNGTLDRQQQNLLAQTKELAEKGGFAWIGKECTELQHRLECHDSACEHRWHDQTASLYPYMLDCVLPQNHWCERLKRISDVLEMIPQRNLQRLAWNVKLEAGMLTAVPMEQRFYRSHWSKGCAFKKYQTQNWENITENIEIGNCDFEMLPQDKMACHVLKYTVPGLKKHQEPEVSENDSTRMRLRWSQVFQALLGHPRIYLDGADGHHLQCVSAVPYVEITDEGDNLRYTLCPKSTGGSHLEVRLERGENLCVYEFDRNLQILREQLGEDFQIPRNMLRENSEMVLKLLEHYNITSTVPLDFLNLKSPDRKMQMLTGSTLPIVQLLPGKNGLHVELLFSPFPDGREFFPPVTGPIEKILFVKGTATRVVRNLDEELKNAQEILEACPALVAANANAPEQKEAASETSPWVWNLETNRSYELSLELQAISSRCRIQWPEDRKFICRQVLTVSNVSLRTDSYQNWFGIDGEIKLEDEDAGIDLNTLIQQVAVEKKRFISLSDGQIAALSEGLRKNLEELNRLGIYEGSNGTGQLRISKFLMPFIGETLNSFGKIEQSEQNTRWLKQYAEAMKATPGVPAGLQATLRPYQMDGFTWLNRLDSINAGACLADDMGLGKTLQAIALILAHAHEGPCLIVAPTSVCLNWYNELKRFAPKLECSIFGGGDRLESLKRISAGSVMIATYGLLQSEQTAFRKTHWRIAVLDEAQAIKNSHAKRSRAALEIDADFRLVTTGTPVENNLSEMWSIFNFIIPGLLGRREDFQRKYAALIEREGDKKAAEQLRKLVSPFLLRRRKDQVLTDLPPKQDIEYPITLSEPERAFYDNLRQKIAKGLEDDSDNDNVKRTDRVLCGITMLCEAVDHPAMINGAGGEGLGSSKLAAFLELLKGLLENDHKVLVFSRYVKFLEIVCRALDENSVRYMYLDGNLNTAERSKAIEGFQNGEAPVFVISLQAGGLGLNLTAADYVIHLDSWWNPAVENQASDRAHRLGQQKPVTVYHLRVKDTIEEKILKLHQRKQNLSDQMLADTDDIAKKTTIEELRKLICD